jgi:ATP-binding cassette, subfamily B, multidrug efflux pump
MSAYDEEAQLGKLYDHRLVRKLWPFLRKYRRKLVLIALTASIMVAGQVAWPLLFSQLAVVVVEGGMSGRLAGWLALFAVVVGVGAVADFISTYLADATSQRLVADLRSKLYQRFQRLPLSYFDRIPSGKVLARLQNDPDALTDLLEVGFVTVVRNGLMLTAVAVAMLVLDWRMALAALGPVPVVVLIALVYRPLMRRAFRDVRRKVSALNARMEENIAGHSTVLVLNQEERCSAELDEANAELRRAKVKAVILHALFPPWIHAAFGAGMALLLYSAGVRYLQGEEQVVKKAIAFVIFMQQFGWPLQEMLERLQILQAAMAALERIFGFLEQPGEDLAAPLSEDGPGIHPEGRSRGEIEFRDVWFAYREGEWILKGLSFRAARGERVAIAGPTGAGKTTILSLASALYRPQKGQIFLDGKDLAELDPRYVRCQVATVIQDVFMFNDSVQENVRLWESGISAEDVRGACARAHSSVFVEKLENGYQQKLGQRGGDLSAGQRQLLSFARALAYDPPVLILDEATSSVDAETEENIRQGLEELTSGRTSLIVAHRFSTLADADRLLVIRDGQLAEETTPNEFLAKRKGGEDSGAGRNS